MASKGQIHEALGKILRYIKNLIKLDNKLGWEISKIDISKKKTPRKIQGAK